MENRHQIASLLIDLEAIMRSTGLWSDAPPAAEALASVQPFCVDTLELAEWLQFIFIPRMYALIDSGAPLPAKCEIKPVVEEAMDKPGRDLLRVIGELDTLITRQS